jgi:hypothetical protein
VTRSINKQPKSTTFPTPDQKKVAHSERGVGGVNPLRSPDLEDLEQVVAVEEAADPLAKDVWTVCQVISF